ncbi:hypothetical protein [Roseibium sp.]|uniref:hypothetical protein n=1 Tax=Roseibium sp. TaxID=1936156 RepID=UPI003A96E0A7
MIKTQHERHMDRLRKNVHADLAALMPEKTAREKKREAVRDAVSSAWNRRQKRQGAAAAASSLPEGWRNEHWKTLQKLAEDLTGQKAETKAEAVAILESCEAGQAS